MKSCTMDLWDPEQIAFMQAMGNGRAKSVYEAKLPSDYGKPGETEKDELVLQWIRTKYERKRYYCDNPTIVIQQLLRSTSGDTGGSTTKDSSSASWSQRRSNHRNSGGGGGGGNGSTMSPRTNSLVAAEMQFDELMSPPSASPVTMSPRGESNKQRSLFQVTTSPADEQVKQDPFANAAFQYLDGFSSDNAPAPAPVAAPSSFGFIDETTSVPNSGAVPTTVHESVAPSAFAFVSGDPVVSSTVVQTVHGSASAWSEAAPTITSNVASSSPASAFDAIFNHHAHQSTPLTHAVTGTSTTVVAQQQPSAASGLTVESLFGALPPVHAANDRTAPTIPSPPPSFPAVLASTTTAEQQPTTDPHALMALLQQQMAETMRLMQQKLLEQQQQGGVSASSPLVAEPPLF